MFVCSADTATAVYYRDWGTARCHIRAVSAMFVCAGKKVQSFAVSGPGAEVTHACVFHSGTVALAYASDSSPPELTLCTWENRVTGSQLDVAQKYLPMPVADKPQLFEAMALLGVPLIHTDAGSQLGAMQVCLVVPAA